jgi:hypothetical protein
MNEADPFQLNPMIEIGGTQETTALVFEGTVPAETQLQPPISLPRYSRTDGSATERVALCAFRRRTRCASLARASLAAVHIYLACALTVAAGRCIRRCAPSRMTRTGPQN